MWGKSAYCWNTMLTGRRFEKSVVTSFPSRTMRPSSGTSKPAIIRSVVVLPQPLGPSSEKNSPSRIDSVTSRTAAAFPKRLPTFSNAIATLRSGKRSRPHGRRHVVRFRGRELDGHASGDVVLRHRRALPRSVARGHRAQGLVALLVV